MKFSEAEKEKLRMTAQCLPALQVLDSFRSPKGIVRLWQWDTMIRNVFCCWIQYSMLCWLF